MSNNSAKSLLKEKGLRSTQGRVRVLEELSSSKIPVTVADLYKRLGAGVMDQVTLYRTLETFVNADIVRSLSLRKDCAHYELSDDHHHHVVCTECGTMKDFDGCDIEKMAQSALSQVKGFASITKHSFELFGLCTRCARMV